MCLLSNLDAVAVFLVFREKSYFSWKVFSGNVSLVSVPLIVETLGNSPYDLPVLRRNPDLFSLQFGCITKVIAWFRFVILIVSSAVTALEP